MKQNTETRVRAGATTSVASAAVASGNSRVESGEWRQAAQRAGKPNLPELPLEQQLKYF